MFDNAEFVVESTPVAGQQSGKSPNPNQTAQDRDLNEKPLNTQVAQDFETAGLNAVDDVSNDEVSNDELPNFDSLLEDKVPDAVLWQEDHTEVITDFDMSDMEQVVLVDSEGNRFPIQQFPFSIGRAADCDLVLEGRGISRRHVELIYQSGRFVVNDLESLNGIRVNGYKVARVLLEDGDEIKIGDASLKFSNVGAKGKKPEPEIEKPDTDKSFSFNMKASKPKLKLAGLIIGSIFMAACAWSGFQYWVGMEKGSNILATAVEVEKDIPNAETVVADTHVDSNGSDAAAPLANKLDESIAYAFLVDNELDEALSAVNLPPPENITPVQTIFADVSPRTLAPEKVSPPKSISAGKEVPFHSNVAENKANQLLSLADKKYLRGEAPQVIKELREAQSFKGIFKKTISKLVRKRRQLEGLYGAYEKGNDSFRAGNKRDGFDLWTVFLDKEKKVFIANQRSVYAIEVISRVMQEFVDKASTAKKNGDHHKAYYLWKKALEVGDSIEARVAISNVELRSKQLYRKGLRLEYVNSQKARDAWALVVDMVPPGTEYYTKANSKIAWYTQWSVN